MGRKDEMTEVKNYFVSLIDILGFSNLVNNQTSVRDIEKIYTSLKRTLFDLPDVHMTQRPNDFFRIYVQGFFPTYAREIIDNLYNFSDSIIFFIESSDDDNEENMNKFKAICLITNEFLKSPIIKDPRIFQFATRGAVAYGPAIMNNKTRIHIGRPIIDSYLLAEHQNWMGGAIHYTVPEDLILPLVGYNNEIYEYQIPLNRDFERPIKYALNWVQRHPNEKEYNSTGIRIPIFGDIGRAHILHYDWGDHEDKRDNTIKFVETICNEYERRLGANNRLNQRTA